VERDAALPPNHSIASTGGQAVMKPSSEQESEMDPQMRKPLLVGDDAEDMPIVLEGTSELQDTEAADADEKPSVGEADMTGPAWQGYLFAALPVLICFLGAGRETWSKGLAAVLLGIVVLIFRPRRKLPSFVTFCFAVALLAPLSAFLPADILLSQPEWRTRLVEDWGVKLSDTLSPQAGVSLEAWMFFALCVVSLYWSLARGFSQLQRLCMLHMLALGGATLCLLSLLEAWEWIRIPWWPRNRIEWGSGFGPFANRNHISSIAAITSVLCASCAFDAHRRKKLTWPWFITGFVVAAVAIFSNSSRAGLALLFVGFTIWLGTSAMGRGFFKKMTVTISVVLIISTLLVVSSGGLATRLSTAPIDGMASADGRLLIYGKTLDIILQSPWMGIGLGNFEGVFPQFQGESLLKYRTIHPESDYLWLISECGLLTFLPCAFIMGWFFTSVGPWFKRSKSKRRSSRDDRRLRNAAAIGVILAVLHGVVDVPSHGIGYWSWVVLMAGIALRPSEMKEPAKPGAMVVMKLAGFGAISAGVAWLMVAEGRPVMQGASSAEMLRLRANRSASAGALADALSSFDQAIHRNPMDYRLYHERAQVRLQMGHAPADVLEDFSRSRALQSNDPAACYQEGMIWLGVRPEFALIPWRQLLARSPQYYEGMLQHANTHPQLRRPLWLLANTLDLKLSYLKWVSTPEDFNQSLRSILTAQPDLGGMETAQRASLFRKWYELGNKEALIAALESNQQWREAGWQILAEHYAINSQFQRACALAGAYLPSTNRTGHINNPDVAALERAMLYNPTDPRRAIDLFQAQKNQGNIDDALRTLEKVVKMPGAPPYVRQEIAALYIAKEDYRRAWEYLREAMNEVRKP